MAITNEQKVHATLRIRTEANGMRVEDTVYIAQYKQKYTANGVKRQHVKVLVSPEAGRIVDITRYVGLLGGFRFTAGNSLIVISEASECSTVVAKALEVAILRAEVI